MEIKSKVDKHWDTIGDIRKGDVLTRLCGKSWIMEGSDGRVYCSSTPKVHVTAVG